MAVDGGDDPIANHQSADVASRLGDVLLDVENRVLVRAEHGLVFQDGLCRVAVVDFRQQASPRADHRFEHHRIAHRLDGFQGGLRGEGDARGRLRHPRGGEGVGRGDFVAAGLGHRRGVDGWDAPGVERLQGVQPAGVTDTALQHSVIPLPGGRVIQVEVDFAVVQAVEIHAALLQGGENPLFLNAQA